jgi:hypothetical protein
VVRRVPRSLKAEPASHSSNGSRDPDWRNRRRGGSYDPHAPTGRGTHFSLLLIDEAARVPEELYEAVLPMLGPTNGDLWLMSTPHGKRGFFWEEWSQGGSEWARVQVPATECPRIHPEFLERQRRRRPERAFRQEYLCEFTSTDYAVFSEDSILRALRWNARLSGNVSLHVI